MSTVALHSRRSHPIHPPVPEKVFLDDELSSSDIICYGSSDDEAPEDVAAQMRRIRTKAENYVRGLDSLYIHTASLRGPMVKNPWRKKRPDDAQRYPPAEDGELLDLSTEESSVEESLKPNIAGRISKAYGIAMSAGEAIGPRRQVVQPKHQDAKTTFRRAARTRGNMAPPSATRWSRHVDDFTMGDIPHGVSERRNIWRRLYSSSEDVSPPPGVEVSVRWVGRRHTNDARDTPPLPFPRSSSLPSPHAAPASHLSRLPSRPPSIPGLQHRRSPALEGKDVLPRNRRKRARTVPDEQPRSPAEAPKRDLLDSITLNNAKLEVDWNKKRPKIDFAAQSPALAPNDRLKNKKKRRAISERTVIAKTKEKGSEQNHSRDAGKENAAVKWNAAEDEIRTVVSEPSPAPEPDTGSQDLRTSKLDEPSKERSNPQGKETDQLLPNPVVEQHAEEGAIGVIRPNVGQNRIIREADAIKSQAIKNYISDMSFTETTTTPSDQRHPQNSIEPSLPSSARKASPTLPQPVAQPETPWAGTQNQLKAATEGFFNLMAESPFRFDSCRTPQTVTNDVPMTIQQTQATKKGTPLLASTPSFALTDNDPGNDTTRGIIRPPFLADTNQQKGFGSVPLLPSLPFESPVKPGTAGDATLDSTADGFVIVDEEPTPFCTFRSPTATPGRQQHNDDPRSPTILSYMNLDFSSSQEPTSEPPHASHLQLGDASLPPTSTPNKRAVSSSRPPRTESTKKSVAFLDLSLSMESTQKDPTQTSTASPIPDASLTAASGFVNTMRLSLNLESKLEDPSSSVAYVSPDPRLRMGQQGMDLDDETLEEDEEVSGRPHGIVEHAEEDDGVKEMMGILGGKWDIDNELMKMVGNGMGSGSKKGKGRKKGRRP
jgi:hypothetical protein